MTAAENTVQASEKEMSELKLRVKDLGDENRLLIEILNSNGVQFLDRLEALRHKRNFTRICGKHPLGTTATAAESVVKPKKKKKKKVRGRICSRRIRERGRRCTPR